MDAASDRRAGMARRIAAACCLLLLALDARSADVLSVYTEAAAAQLDARAQAALARMPATKHQLLATRAYLRSGAHFGNRWSWTQAQIERYRNSPEQRAALAELERIRTHFAQMNPGYTLHVNTEVRSLDTQIERWNTNPGVARTADQLRRAAARELASDYPAQPTTLSGARFADFLKQWTPLSPAPLAAPGLSRHGQARAFDFYVTRGDRIVAATDMGVVKSVWDRQGWTDKLKAAVAASSDRFKGPLAVPYEPWHYEYEASDEQVAESR
jgi:hypothetical protein